MRTVKENRRSEKARLTRQRIRDAAYDLFVEHGYGVTALQDVADRAGVAVQTIYFVFGTKRALLKELVDVAIAGDDEPVATMDRPWFRAALKAETASEQLRLHIDGTRQILSGPLRSPRCCEPRPRWIRRSPDSGSRRVIRASPS